MLVKNHLLQPDPSVGIATRGIPDACRSGVGTHQSAPPDA